MHPSGVAKSNHMLCRGATSTSMLFGTAKAPKCTLVGCDMITCPVVVEETSKCMQNGGGGGQSPGACPMVGQRPLPCLFAGHTMWGHKIIKNAL